MSVARTFDVIHESASPRALVVDDMSDVARVPGRRLAAFGDRVICRRSAREALQVPAARADTALAICDIHMPGLTGLDRVRLLRTRFPALRMRPTSGTAGGGGDTGPEGIVGLPKPIVPATLERVVEKTRT